jgi:hypothetical protein
MLQRSQLYKKPSRLGQSQLPSACFLISAGLIAILSVAAGGVFEQIFSPVPAQAYTGRMNVTLTVAPGETFEVLLRRAENVARAAAQRNFDRDILVTDVLIMVSAEYESRVAPVLTLTATRNQWKNRPDARRWATYFRSSQALLGLDQPTSNTAVNPNPPAPPAPTSSGSPQVAPSEGSPAAPPAGAPPETSPPPPSDALPETGESANTPILPDRIPTPGRIGK